MKYRDLERLREGERRVRVRERERERERGGGERRVDGEGGS